MIEVSDIYCIAYYSSTLFISECKFNKELNEASNKVTSNGDDDPMHHIHNVWDIYPQQTTCIC